MIADSLFADVILPLPLDYQFTYRVPADLRALVKPGIRVVVQFGRRKYYSALVYKLRTTEPEGDFDLKDIETVLDEHPVVEPDHLRLWEWMADYYCCSIGDIYKAALPTALKLESHAIVSLNADNCSNNLSDDEYAVVSLLERKQNVSVQKVNRLLGQKKSFATIKLLLEKNTLVVQEQLNDSFKPKLEATVRLSPDIDTDEKLIEVLDRLKKTKKQEQLLNFFLSETKYGVDNRTEMPKKELMTKAGVSESVLKGLEDRQIVQIFQKEIGRIDRDTHDGLQVKNLSNAQQLCYNEILTKFDTHQSVLLHGVTSSGKTEIYIRLIEEQLKLGKQVLYLVPEISLTPQIINRLRFAFGGRAGIYHSKFNDSERVEIWFDVLGQKQGRAGRQYQVVLGARSAIFLPFTNLGLIIVDEEHENSYKQVEPAPRYHARDTAIMMGNIYGAKVLLGSATPSYETYFNARSDKYGLVRLTERFRGAELPVLVTANTREAARRKLMQSIFTPELYSAVNEALEAKEQVILFQNRRGFAPYLQCGECGWIPKCNFCDVSLTYHKNQSSLICHYCGHIETLFLKCKKCGSSDMRARGFGTEKIEDEIKLLFPDARVARMDLDTMRAKKAFEHLIMQFETGKLDILVGTQMVAKGLDFDDVSVVGVLDADSLLNYPDFRSYERSYQLIAQVGGRAGRKNKPGVVVVQTSQPDHVVIQDVTAYDYERLFYRQLEERKMFFYPPYSRLIKIVCKHRDKAKVDQQAMYLGNALRKLFGSNVLGPGYPVVAKVQNWFQKDIFIKLPRDGKIVVAKHKIKEIIGQLKALPNNSGLIVYVDVDPQ